jgi:hypothetical protein
MTLTLRDGDQLDHEERARLHAAIEEAQDQLDRGEGIPAEQFLAELRSPRRGGSGSLASPLHA